MIFITVTHIEISLKINGPISNIKVDGIIEVSHQVPESLMICLMIAIFHSYQ